MCGAGRRGWIIVGIRLTKYQLRAWVDDDMELFEVFHYSMEILEVKTAAGVIAALWRIATGQSVTRNETCGKETHEVAFAFYGGKTVHGGTSVRLYESGYISGILEVD